MSMRPSSSNKLCARTEQPLRVMVVDDAIVVRSLLARWIDGEPDMEVVASLRTGREAVDRIEQQRCRRRRARHRHARTGRHIGFAAAFAEKARPRRDHGLHVHAPERRDQLPRAGAWRRRLHPQARDHARSHDFALVPPRTDRKSPHPWPSPRPHARLCPPRSCRWGCRHRRSNRQWRRRTGKPRPFVCGRSH